MFAQRTKNNHWIFWEKTLKKCLQQYLKKGKKVFKVRFFFVRIFLFERKEKKSGGRRRMQTQNEVRKPFYLSHCMYVQRERDYLVRAKMRVKLFLTCRVVECYLPCLKECLKGILFNMAVFPQVCDMHTVYSPCFHLHLSPLTFPHSLIL